ncbi:MAG: hypothetical protein LBU70_02570 [Chitinispirillales bacterium]|jgi:ribonuclease D|nr:hypothetical protein [Chitinispirillales bacterium]
MMITTEEQLQKYVDNLREKEIRKIALDLEGDQGMFHYNHSISIFQCFDGEEATIIDVLKMGNNSTLREFLTCQDIIKVMFSCGNDMFMTQNVLSCTITPVNDIAIAQKLLGMPVNLVDYLNIDKEEKDGFQRANWLARPIKPTLLEYAINDVLKLLEIEDNLITQLKNHGLYDEYIKGSRAASEKKYATNRHELFVTKFPGYPRLPFIKKKIAATVWIFRELLGEKFDCPVGYLLSRKALADIINSSDNVAVAIEREINRDRNSHKRLGMSLIKSLLEKAAQSPYIPEKPVVRRRQL